MLSFYSEVELGKERFTAINSNDSKHHLSTFVNNYGL